MIGYIQTGKLENCTRREKGQNMQLAPNFYIDKGNEILYKRAPNAEYFKAVPVILKKLMPKILEINHERRGSGGHFGYKTTLQEIKMRYYFPKMQSIVKNHVLSCHECQIHKNNTEKLGNLKPMPIDNFKPMEYIQIDFIGKFSNQSEKKYIIVAVDKAMKVLFYETSKTTKLNGSH